ncbi:MAG: bifunctional 5,10-methylenetetrahydrofolate dehydrogenase/5,10-methenyltetrahydrofolate cyclohydrolase [Anaerovoracaceae bacterium]|jgi:methylenetetrahydrofolate dehydrogenase (NADP+)/methenyltetrahydrofolate cyclohydrolase
MADILYGKPVADALADETAQRVDTLRSAGIDPCLLIVRVGDDPGDLSYERSATRRCESMGIAVRTLCFEPDVSGDELVCAVREAGSDASVHGILILRPLPAHIDDRAVREALPAEKDVDGITDGSLSGVYAGNGTGYAPCTAEACVRILEHYGIPVEGKHAVVAGRSLVIGRPAAMLMLHRHATVTICHSRTSDLAGHCLQADILIAASGSREALTALCYRAGQVVLDVGIHVDSEGRVLGDVDYETAERLVGAITPVPGGVGAVTTAVLADHVVRAAGLALQTGRDRRLSEGGRERNI